MRQFSHKTHCFLLLIPGSLFLFQTFACADTFGNSLNPSVINNTRTIDPDGITYLKQSPSRTPSGLLYKSPHLPKIEKILGDSWHYLGSIEFGYLSSINNENAAEFND